MMSEIKRSNIRTACDCVAQKEARVWGPPKSTERDARFVKSYEILPGLDVADLVLLLSLFGLCWW